MKRSKLNLAWMLLLAVFALTACSDDDNGNTPLMEDGYYVVGESIATSEISLNGMMQDGWVDKYPNPSEVREGLFVKFMHVNTGGGFLVKQQVGSNVITYGIDGAWVQDEVNTWAKTATFIQDGNPFTVSEAGFYMFIFDATTSKVAILSINKVGLLGDFTTWGNDILLEEKSMSAESASWEATGVTLKNGYLFKFRVNEIWNYTIAEGVAVQTNFGGETLNLPQYGGANYTAAITGGTIVPGVYTAKVNWTFDKGFAVTMTKTAEVVITDWSTTKVEIVGDAIAADNTGAITDDIWTWNLYLYSSNNGLPSKDGNIYTWTWSNVHLLASGFKVRAHETNSFDAGFSIVDATNSNNVVDEGGNIKITQEGNYNITLVIDADQGDVKKLTVTAL